jgi:hypothetical protein
MKKTAEEFFIGALAASPLGLLIVFSGLIEKLPGLIFGGF